MSVVNEIVSNAEQVSANPSLEQPKEKAKTQHRILVVEDDISLARLEARVLAAHNYSVMIVSNGELAITALSDFTPDLVVLDLELSGVLNGWDVLQVLRQNAKIPVLITTSMKPNMRKYFRTYGETSHTLDHLSKPYPMQALLKRVTRMLMIAPQ